MECLSAFGINPKVYQLKNNQLPKTFGVYAIVNTISHKFYIGSTEDGFHQRFLAHRADLRAGYKYFLNPYPLKKGKKSPGNSPYLQRAYNKMRSELGFGDLEGWEVWILIECEAKYALQYEQLFLNFLDPHYNICKTAGNTKGVKMSAESSRKKSEATKGRNHTPEAIANIKAGKLANPFYHTDESKQKLSDSHSKPYRVYKMGVGYIEGVNLSKLWKKENISWGAWTNVINEIRWQCKGYFKNEERYLLWLKTQDRWFEIYYPEEGLIRHNGIMDFCKSRKLTFSSIFLLLQGENFTSQGYFRNEEDYLVYLERNRNNPQSEYEGVSWSKVKRKWCARIGYKDPITNKRKTKNLGYFTDDHDAYLEYLDAAEQLKEYRSGRGRKAL